MDCVATSEIEAALDHYQTIEGIPTLVKPGNTGIPHERRQECNQLLSCILEVVTMPLCVWDRQLLGITLEDPRIHGDGSTHVTYIRLPEGGFERSQSCQSLVLSAALALNHFAFPTLDVLHSLGHR